MPGYPKRFVAREERRTPPGGFRALVHTDPPQRHDDAPIVVKHNGWRLTIPAVVLTGAISVLGQRYAPAPANEDTAAIRARVESLARESEYQHHQIEELRDELRGMRTQLSVLEVALRERGK